MGLDGHIEGRMSGVEFRAFQAGRPDHERWELLEGIPMMMAPPTIAHNQIASHLDRLLNERLQRYAPPLIAIQRPGLELGGGDYKPEPDVVVIDADYAAGQRFVEKAYLLAEVTSEADDVMVRGMDRPWIDVKRDLYRGHEHCKAVIFVAHDRMRARRIDPRGDVWTAEWTVCHRDVVEREKAIRRVGAFDAP
jgi:Uma2 family endonuclease